MNFVKIKSDVNDFLLLNKDRYEILSKFQDILDNLSLSSYDDVIQFFEIHSDFFFKNHSNAIFFFFNIIRTAQFNFKEMELYLDICIYFQIQLKAAAITESELIIICMEFPNAVNYFFSRNFFQISSIIELSAIYPNLFINFLPEIEEYDPKYAKMREENLVIDRNDISFYNFVKFNPEKHVINRSLNYHPSSLHKVIREDDFDKFQIILSRNNYSINHKIEYSPYERSRMIEKEMSLIQIAAVYGSLTIFKFLSIQKRIIISKNLLSYAYFGYNYEIIHLCEQRCSYRRVYIQPFLFHHNDLLNYYIENFGNNIHECNKVIKNILTNYKEEEDNYYQILNSDNLKNAIFAFNFDIIKSCLHKIVFIVNNIELNFDLNFKYDSFLKSSKFDIELFKFLYNQAMVSHNYEFDQRVNFLYNLMKYNGNDAFKIVLNDEKNKENVLFILRNSFKMNHDISNFILDKMKNGEMIIDKDEIEFNDVLSAIQYYNENIVVKLISLKDFFNEKENISKFVSQLLKSVSVKMMNSLFIRLSSVLQKSVLFQMKDLFNDDDSIEIRSLINDILSNGENNSIELKKKKKSYCYFTFLTIQ